MEKKKIYLADNIEVLVKLTDISKVPFDNIKSICKLLDKVYQEYEKATLERDEELCFIYLMRFLDLFTKARKVFIGDTKFLSSYVGDSKIMSSLSKAEELKKSLTERYKSAKEVKKVEEKVVISDPNEPVTCQQLYKAIKQKEAFVLIDARSPKEFDKCTIKNRNVVNIPSSNLRKGSSVSDIERMVEFDEVQNEVWASRSSASMIIVMDWDTASSALNDEISWLIAAIWEWDAKKRCAVKPRILHGGLKKFLDCYPTFVTNSEYSGPADINDSSHQLISFHDIQYPDMQKKLKPALKKNQVENGAVTPSSGDKNPAKDLDISPQNDHQKPPGEAIKTDPSEKMSHRQPPSLEIDRSKKPTKSETQTENKVPVLPDPTAPKSNVPVNSSSSSRGVGTKLTPLIPERSQKPQNYGKSGIIRPVSPIKGSGGVGAPPSPTERSSNKSLSNLKRCTSQPNLSDDHNHPDTSPRDSSQHSNEEEEELTMGPLDNHPHVPSVPDRGTKPHKGPASEHSCSTSQDINITTSNNTVKTPMLPPSSELPTAADGSGVPSSSQLNKLSTTTTNPPAAPAARSSIINLKPSFNKFSATQIANFSPVYRNVKPGLTGLRNQGNTCYMNSVIQALSNTKFLVTYLRQPDKWRLDVNPSNPLGNGGIVVKELANVLQALWSEKYGAVTPFDLRKAITTRVSGGSLFAGYEQHDSQEFLAFLLDGLHEDLNKAANGMPRPEPPTNQNENDENDDNELSDSVKAERAWKMYLSRNDSVIVSLFQGMFRSEVRCNSCSKVSVTFEPFQYLSLPLPSSVVNVRTSLQECLALFEREESMQGGSQWNCPRCARPRDARKRIALYRLPPYLLVHLKRFSYTAGGLALRQKISSSVDYPVHTLDLTPHLPPPSGPHLRHSVYHLYAVSNHHGNMESGHYTSYCKNFHSGRWFNFDDDMVSEVREADVKTASAYILFYESENMHKSLQTNIAPK